MKQEIQKMLEERLKALKERKAFLSDEKNLPMVMEQLREANAKPYVLPDGVQEQLRLDKETKYGMDVFILKGENYSGGKQILYLHGGAYVNQPVKEHWEFLNKVTKETGATITIPIYPKAPNHQYQESFDKVFPIYEELLIKTDPNEIVLMGDSAGGGFALALAQLVKEKGLPQPSNIILLSPWLDMTMSNPEIQERVEIDLMLALNFMRAAAKAYAGDSDLTNYLLSPLYGNINGLGKITMFGGTHELLLPDFRKFKDMAEKQGVNINYFEYPNMIHVFPLTPLPEAELATKQIINIINEEV